MAPNRNDLRIAFLQTLAMVSADFPGDYVEPMSLGIGLTELQLVDAIRYLSDKGLIDALYSAGDRGLAPTRITAAGQDFLENAAAFTSDRDLGNLALTVIHNSTIGNLANGGTGHTFGGAAIVINYPRADALRKDLQAFDLALARDTTLDEDQRDEIRQHVQVIRKELAKPFEEQRQETIERRWKRIQTLTAGRPSLFTIVTSLEDIFLATHGGHVG